MFSTSATLCLACTAKTRAVGRAKRRAHVQMPLCTGVHIAGHGVAFGTMRPPEQRS
jgi:hypothetical protein